MDSPTGSSLLERLPVELRTRIYRYCLGYEYCTENYTRSYHTVSNLKHFFGVPSLVRLIGSMNSHSSLLIERRFRFSTSLFRANKRLGEEIRRLFYFHSRFVRFHCDRHDEVGNTLSWIPYFNYRPSRSEHHFRVSDAVILYAFKLKMLKSRSSKDNLHHGGIDVIVILSDLELLYSCYLLECHDYLCGNEDEGTWVPDDPLPI